MDVEEEEEDEYDDVEREDVEEENRSHHTLCEPAQSKCTWIFDKSHFVWTFTRKMPDPNGGDIVSCEPAQSNRTRTFHKSHFVWKLTGKMLDTSENTSIKHRPLEPLSVATLFGEKTSRIYVGQVLGDSA